MLLGENQIAQFALIRAVDLRLRGSSMRFHGAGFSDGAGLCRVF